MSVLGPLGGAHVRIMKMSIFGIGGSKMKTVAFACKAKDLRKNLKFLWEVNRVLSLPKGQMRTLILNLRYGVS